MNMKNKHSDSFISTSEQETIAFGKNFASQLQQNDVVALFGDLGSGKTRFTRGICSAFGVQQHVASPTFTIVNEYDGSKEKIFHFDLYRLNSSQEIFQLGFNDYINNNGICIIEWAERAEELLPQQRFDVYFSLGKNENERIIKIEKKVINS